MSNFHDGSAKPLPEVISWESNYIPYFYMDVIIYPCLELDVDSANPYL